ncbi:MAG: sterol desaturase family protein [Leptospirales bacterium]|nr:sterol desaturase family protein [Leptospirales bacterium]
MTEFEVPNYIVYAIPFFFLLIGLEALLGRLAKRDYYQLNDSINDLSMGSYQQLLGVLLRSTIFLSYFLLYDLIWTRYRLLTFEADSVAGWILGFFLVDFAYYWFHRKSHEVAIIWGSHEPHHQSQEYNLSVALRQGAFQGLFSWPFYLPIALLGIHPIIFFTHSQFNTIYQFWIHTRAIGRMGFLEAFLNTPSHHRVHHGVNPKYIDRNHAGTLIIWDKLFGTFQAEEEEPAYGTVKPLNSWNPLWGQLRYWTELARKSAHAPGLWKKMLVWLKGPGWDPLNPQAPEHIPEVSRRDQRRYNPPMGRGLAIYALLQFALTIVISLAVLQVGPRQLDAWHLVLAGFALISMLSIGALMEGQSWGSLLEGLRLGALGGGGALWLSSIGLPAPISMMAALAGVALAAWMLFAPPSLRRPASA